MAETISHAEGKKPKLTKRQSEALKAYAGRLRADATKAALDADGACQYLPGPVLFNSVEKDNGRGEMVVTITATLRPVPPRCGACEAGAAGQAAAATGA